MFSNSITDAKGDAIELLTIRNHLEAETLARALARVFGENTFKVIRARSPGKRFSS